MIELGFAKMLPAAESAKLEGQTERVLKTFVLAEFQSTASAVADQIALVIEDCAASGLDAYASDLAIMGENARKLIARIRDYLVPGGGGELPPSDAAMRHDLRTPVTVIFGYGELIAEEARDAGEAILVRQMAAVRQAASRLLDDIDKLIEFSPVAAGQPGAGAVMRPDVMRLGMDVVRALKQTPQQAKAVAKGRILAVDDNAALLDTLQRRLERDGHDVTTCGEGDAAFALACDGAFDLVLLDVMMPGVSGLDLLRRLKDVAPRLPVIMVSALDEMDIIARCLDEGAEDYLSKPVEPALLRARVSASLERKFLRDREQATQEKLRVAQARSDQLLRNVLPDSIVARLGAGEEVRGDFFEDASILFCDLVGFSELASRWPPGRLLSLLNSIFSGFDGLVATHGLEKIKTIGDAYMVAGGLPEARPDHLASLARMALDMPGIVEDAARRYRISLDCRIGLASGPVIAGIIGETKFFYDVWGNTVNAASRMETASAPGRIQVTGGVRNALRQRFEFASRGVVAIKGLGEMETYFLIGEHKRQPAFDASGSDLT